LAQAFRTYAEAHRSGEKVAPEDTDAENTFIPPVDIFSTEKAFVLHVSLPGAKKEDVGVNWDADKGLLNLAGVVYRHGDEEFLKTLSKSERKVGVFDRSIKLPPADQEKEEIDGDEITAKLEDGVLIVTVPKVEKEWTEIKKVDVE
jgi:HSP20 family protein